MSNFSQQPLQGKVYGKHFINMLSILIFLSAEICHWIGVGENRKEDGLYHG